MLIGLRGRPWVSFNLEAGAHHPQAQGAHGVFCIAPPQDWFLMTHPPVTGAPSWGGRGPLSQTFPRAEDGGDPDGVPLRASFRPRPYQVQRFSPIYSAEKTTTIEYGFRVIFIDA